MCGSEESDDDGGAHLINTATDQANTTGGNA